MVSCNFAYVKLTYLYGDSKHIIHLFAPYMQSLESDLIQYCMTLMRSLGL